jgi:hypothetical protein
MKIAQVTIATMLMSGLVSLPRAVAIISAESGAATKNVFAISVLDEHQVTSAEHASVVVVVKNIGSKPMGLNRYPGGYGEMNFKLDITASDGKPAVKTKYYRAVLGESIEGQENFASYQSGIDIY